MKLWKLLLPLGRVKTHSYLLLSTEFLRLHWSLKSFAKVQDLCRKLLSFCSLFMGWIVLKAESCAWAEGALLMIGWLEKSDFFYVCMKEKSKTGNNIEWGCEKSKGFGASSSLGCTSLMLFIKSENIWLGGDLASFISLELMNELWMGLWFSKMLIMLKLELQRKSLLLSIMLRLSNKCRPESNEDNILRCIGLKIS